MSANDKVKNRIKELEELLKFDDQEERLELKASIIQLDLLEEVKELMKEKKMSRKALAEKLKKSPSFVSQLFSGDKLLNLKMIAQLQEIFDAKFIPGFKYYSSYSHSRSLTKEDYNTDPDYVKKEIPIHKIEDHPKFSEVA